MYHRGSVIPFINLEDVRHIIREFAPNLQPNWTRFQKTIVSLEKCNQLKSNLARQILATEKLQQALLHQYFSEIKSVP